ncbi:MAG: class I SAM-dependent DNA methyltransferase, partial [Phormidesmis sp.]
GQPFTDADRDYNNKALVSALKQIHDDLDRAFLDAYGWPPTITDEQILENLVALNAERAEEERNGLIRWLRPDYQNPGQAPEELQPQQVTLEVLPTEAPIIAPVEQQKWPTQPKEQLAAIRDLLRTTPGEWSAKQIAAQFKGNITQKKLEAISENLERLEWFGLAISRTSNGLTVWHYADAA